MSSQNICSGDAEFFCEGEWGSGFDNDDAGLKQTSLTFKLYDKGA